VFGGLQAALNGISIPSAGLQRVGIMISAVTTAQPDPTTGIDKEDALCAVWTDLSGDSGCTLPGNEPTETGSTCKTRIWFGRSKPGDPSLEWDVIKKITPSPDPSLNDEFHPRLIQIPRDSFSRLPTTTRTTTLLVVYYRSGTATTDDGTPRLATDVYMRISEDLGDNWSDEVKLTTSSTSETPSPPADQYQYGNYIGLTGQYGYCYAAWTDRRGGGTEQIWGCPITVPAIAQPCSNPLLTSARISFFTKTDGKNDDTSLSIQLNDRYEIIAALEIPAKGDGNPGVTFTGTNRYQLPLRLPLSSTKDDIEHGILKLIIHPYGLTGDEWVFNVGLDFTFSDGTHLYAENHPSDPDNPYIYMGGDNSYVELDIFTMDWSGNAF
jgi:hypothetical protein